MEKKRYVWNAKGAILGWLCVLSFPLYAGNGRVLGRYLFYNNSLFDANNPGANGYDDFAIARDKAPLLPGEIAGFRNYSSYSRGINGVMVDVAGVTQKPSYGDVEFFSGNSADFTQWKPVSPPPMIFTRPQAGANGSTRITFIFPDGAIKNSWVRIVLKAGGALGLPQEEAFLFGNAVGETGDTTGDAQVTPHDKSQIVAALTRSAGNARAGSIDEVFDFNRDGVVDENDVAIVKENQTTALNSLRLLAPPTPVQAGLPDKEFASEGKLSAYASSNQGKAPILIQSDGSIVFATTKKNGFELTRFLSTGEPDIGFGNQGKAFGTLGSGPNVIASVLEAEGHLFVVGHHTVEATSMSAFAIAAFDLSGIPNATFGKAGVASTLGLMNYPALATTAAIQAEDGAKKILIAGYQLDVPRKRAYLTIVRFATNGVLDPRFHIVQDPLEANFPRGVKPVQVVTYPSAFFVLVQGMAVENKENVPALSVLRFHPNGKRVLMSSPKMCPMDNPMTRALAMNVQENRITVVASCQRSAMVTRLLMDGTHDPHFRKSGDLFTDLGWKGFRSSLRSAQFLSSGKILLGGTSNDGKVSHLAATRLTNEGDLDDTFGRGGVTIIPYLAPYASILEIDPIKSSVLVGGPSFKALLDERFRDSLEFVRLWN